VLSYSFFLSLGDHFSTFPIVNPPRESEIILLKRFAPNIERQQLEQLVDVFTELRQLATDGIITYPYSLRELVSIVKHLHMFPNDSLADVVRNVFDLDNYNSDMLDRLRSILHRHGIPFNIEQRTIQLSTSHRLQWHSEQETWPMTTVNDIHVHSISSLVLAEKIKATSMKTNNSIQRTDCRTEVFSELTTRYRLPLDDTTYVHDFNCIQEKHLALVLTGNPLSLWTFRLGDNQAKKIDLHAIFQAHTNRLTTANYQVMSID
jgi:von Willebrand factor A domain-containing protein 8